MALAALLALALPWSLYATGTYLYQTLQQTVGRAELAMAHLAYKRTEAAREAALAEIIELRERNEAAGAKLSQLQADAASASAARDRLLEERARLDRRVAELEQQVTSLEASQNTLVARLSARATRSSDEAERTIAMTGLDANKLLKELGKASPPQRKRDGASGGPFVAYSSAKALGAGKLGPHSGDIERIVATLDNEEERHESLRRVLSHLPLRAPLADYRIVSDFGKRIDPINGRLAMHTGVDLTSNEPGAAVLATAPGRVVFAGWDGSYGRMVEIDHGVGIHTRYAHLRTISVEVGMQVSSGTQLGIIGSTGRSTGTHVHYEVLVDDRPQDPAKFLKAGQYVFSKE